MHVRRTRRATVAVLCTLGVAVGLGGCGDDDNDTARDATAACTAHADTVTGFSRVFVEAPEPPADSPPSPELISQIQALYDGKVAGPLAALVADAPDELKDELEEISRTAREFRDTGDPSGLDTKEFERLTDTVDAYMQENCTGVKATVAAVNYSFRDLPATLATGTVRIELENQADEAHEMVILTRQPGVTEPFDQLLALPQDQAEQKLAFVEAASVDPGETDYLVAKLAPGDYTVICSFGKGTTDDDEPKEAEPHFTLGMRQDLKVA